MADIGLLFRQKHELNLVASPTKYAEYALTGLLILVSPGIGDLDDKKGSLRLFQDILNSFPKNKRGVRAENAKELFSIEKLIGKLEDLYH